MTKLFLVAGVAALAIASAAAAKPGGGGGGNPHAGGPPAAADGGHGNGGGGHGGGGGGGAAPAFVGGGGHGHGGGGSAPAFDGGGGGGRGHGGGGYAAPAFFGGGGHGHGGGAPAGPTFARGGGGGGGHGHGGGFAHQQARALAGGGGGHGHGGGSAHQQARAFASGGGGQGHGAGIGRQQARQQARGSERQQERMAQQQVRPNGGKVQNQFAGREAEQGKRLQQAQQQAAVNNAVNAEQVAAFRNAQTSFADNGTRGLIDGCPPGLWMKNNGCMPPGQAAKLLGQPLSDASAFAPLYALPQSVSYLYPDTPDYYYRYGNGYLYQVDRGTNLIDALLPLIGGGYAPGQYLPAPYMASYVPDYYGLNSFYPDYGDTCNRYADGVIYEVDCATGYVEDVIPMYAGGYGVGQMIPSAYTYYNVPMQYRSMYYDTPDYGYWYAPGAIYQYDQRTSLITSVAALMAPGFTIGQPLPVGYDVYNVPYDYRTTYYDTPTAWYRYNNGYIYQVDPVTQLVTAIVASLLT